MPEENKTVELKDEELEKVSGGDDLGVDIVPGTGYFPMFTSSLVEINAHGGKYTRTDTGVEFTVSSVSNNCNPGEKIPFSTTYMFRESLGTSFFSFVATSVNNICAYLK